MKRRVFSFLLVLVLTIACLPLSSVSAAQTSDGYIYTVTNGEATITDYTGIGGKLTIPSKLGGYPVTAIGTAAFSSYGSLTSVVIPEGVTSLGRTAFAYNESLTSVTFPSTLKSIGESAFEDCFKLTTATLPKNLKTIGNNCFRLCEKLQITEIPNSVSSIGVASFYGCTSLKTITFGTGLATINNNSFGKCSGLTTVTISEGTTTINYNAFNNCTSLKTVYVPKSLKTVGTKAFSECSALTDVYYAGTPDDQAKISIADENTAFKDAYWHYSGCKFTKQPAGGTVYTGNKLTVTWTLNFTPVKMVLVTATPGPVGRPFTEAKELDNPTATSIELGASPEGGYYNLRAFFGTNSGDYISSNTFTITEVAPPDIPVNKVNIEITGFAPNAKISGAKIKLNTEGVEFVTQGTSPNILQTAFIAENAPSADNILADDINATFQAGKQYYVRIIIDVKDGYARKYTSDQIYVTADGIPCTKTGKGFGGKPDVEGESKALLIYKLPMLVSPDAPTKGDLSGDDVVNNKDVEYLLWHTLFPTTYPVSQNADFNGDSKVDNKDVEYLLWHTLFPDTYPL